MMSAGKSKSTVQIKSEPFEGSYPCFGGNGVRGYVDEYNQDGIGNNVYESLKIVEALEQEKIDLQKNIITAKTKILDLAICGKLVPQDPNDEPASVLLERIRAEKKNLLNMEKSSVIRRNLLSLKVMITLS